MLYAIGTVIGWIVGLLLIRWGVLALIEAAAVEAQKRSLRSRDD